MRRVIADFQIFGWLIWFWVRLSSDFFADIDEIMLMVWPCRSAFRLFRGSTAKEGIAIHIVNEIAQGVVLVGSDKSYGS